MYNRTGLFRSLVGTALVLSLGTIAMGHPGQGSYRPDELVCEMEPGYSIDLIDSLFGTTTKRHQPQTNCYLLGTPASTNIDSLAKEIAAREEVRFCEPNYYVAAPEGLQRSQPFLDVIGTGDIETQPAVATLALSEVWSLETGTDVAVALLDGGVNFDHPEFSDADLVAVYDYVDGDTLPDDVPGGTCSGHGTFVAGILHLVAPGASIHVYRVLDTAGVGTSFDVASALLDAVDNGCKTVNMSLGMIGVDEALDQALLYARMHEVTLVAAAGNDSTDDTNLIPFPASRASCIAVAALDSLNQKADFSNYGVRIDYAAPGTRIYAPFLDTSFAWWDGTSFAAPFVTGLTALLYGLDSTLLRHEIDTLIMLTALNIDTLNPGFEGMLGHGLIRPAVLMRMLKPGQSGDVNLDGRMTSADVIWLVSYVFRSAELPFLDAFGDVNCDWEITAADIIYLVHYIFLAGPPPCTLD